MRRIIAGFLFLSLGIAAGATADPITATSGTIFLPPFGNSASFALEGSAFTATGSGTFSPFLITFNAGQTLDLSQTISIRPESSDMGEITTGGVSQQGFASANFQVTAMPFVVGNVTGTQTLSTPFTLSGVVQLFATPTGSSPLLTESVTGAGTMSLTAEDMGGGHYSARNDLLLTLAASPVSPTPEPASMLLLASGLAAVWQVRRLRRSH